MRLVLTLAAVVVSVTCAPFQHIGQNLAHAQQRYSYIGVGSCAASNCHGSAAPKAASGKIEIMQNEHSHWLTKDKHSKAYDVLLKDRSIKIAQNLKLAEAAEKSDKCLVCHAINVPTNLQGPYYQIEDGVSCEGCHGPAEGWLGPHITQGYEASIRLGMYETKDFAKRAEKCLSCHVGDEQRNVDHELIAAGHPDLVFELDTYSALLPPHWREPKGKWLGAQAWSIGQAVAMRELAKRLTRRTQQAAAPGWPEFAEFDCFACHHEVKNIESTYYDRGERDRLQAGAEWQASWRQAAGYTGVAGIPPWNGARYLIFRHLAAVVAPEATKMLDQELATLGQQMARIAATDPKKVADSANQVVQMVNQLLPQVTGVKFDEPLITTLLRNISGDSAALAAGGVRVAEQTAMALDALAISYRKNVQGADKAITDAIQKLYKDLEDPAAYDSKQFASHMQEIHQMLMK